MLTVDLNLIVFTGRVFTIYLLFNTQGA